MLMGVRTCYLILTINNELIIASHSSDRSKDSVEFMLTEYQISTSH